jgi:hypothetical protein
VGESDETNNGLTAPGTVTIARPDLIVTSLAGAAVGAAAGSRSRSTIGVKNQRRCPPANARAFRRRHLHVRGSAARGAPGAGGWSAMSASTVSTRGATMTPASSVTLPGSLGAGTYFLSAVVDDDDRVPESDETTKRTHRGEPGDGALARSRHDRRDRSRRRGRGSGIARCPRGEESRAGPANAGPFRIGVFLVAAASPMRRRRAPARSSAT